MKVTFKCGCSFQAWISYEPTFSIYRGEPDIKAALSCCAEHECANANLEDFYLSKNITVPAPAGEQELVKALVQCLIPLEALKASGLKWLSELAQKEIKNAIQVGRAALARSGGKS